MCKFTIFLCCVIFLIKCVLTETNLAANDETEVNEGIELVKNAFSTLIHGEDVANSYRDLFVDTSKSLFDHLERGAALLEIPVDDMLKILVQTILVFVANRRVDLIPVDFNKRHVEYGQVINELNRVLDLFATKKASRILLTDFSQLFAMFKNKEVWRSVSALNRETKELIRIEKEKEEVKARQNDEL